jgi:hypothetical protein
MEAAKALGSFQKTVSFAALWDTAKEKTTSRNAQHAARKLSASRSRKS